MYRVVNTGDGFYTDKNNNKWFKEIYTIKQASEFSKSPKGWKDCMNCYDYKHMYYENNRYGW